MATIKQALDLAQNLNVEILYDDNGAYKFRPSLFPGRDISIYIHADIAVSADRKSGLEWRMSRHYTKQQYQVRASSIAYHTFPTIPALYTWLENEIFEQEAREAQEKTERAAQSRADKEGVTVYAVCAGQRFFTATYEEIARNHAEDSIQLLYTATPANQPDGKGIMTQAEPGDTIVYINLNGFEREAKFKSQDSHGIVAVLPDDAEWEFPLSFSQVRTLKKSGSTPDPATSGDDDTSEEEETPVVTGCCYCGESVETEESDKQPEVTIFLGGTCGGNNWRDHMIPALIEGGIPKNALYNPVVEHWTPEVQQREDKIKENALVLYVIASPDPQSSTTNVSAYSISEALMSLYDAPERTVVLFDYYGWPSGVTKRIKKIAHDWKCRFPDAAIFEEEYTSTAQCVASLFEAWNPPPDDERDFPLYLEYQNLF